MAAIAQNLIDIYRRLPVSQAAPLTDTEERVLMLMLEGYDETEIGEKHGAPFETVDGLIVSLCEKVGLTVQPGINRSPQILHHLVNLCVS